MVDKNVRQNDLQNGGQKWQANSWKTDRKWSAK